jgi:hypothetical protein
MNSWCYLQKYTDNANQYKTRRYRANWLVRGASTTANDFSSVFTLSDAATAFTNVDFTARLESLVDLDEWFRFFAVNHALGNWDSVGYRNGQNTYGYKPPNGRWELVMWDANIVIGNSGSDGPSGLPLFTTSDATLTRWFARGSPFRRRLLTAYDQLANGPLQTNVIAPMLDAKYAAFQEHGVVASSPTTIKTWLASARNYILSQITREAAPFAVTNVSPTQPLTLTGTGPLEMAALEVNGVTVAVIWDSTSAWRAFFWSPTDRLVVVALDTQGRPIANALQEVNLVSDQRLLILRTGSDLLFEYPVIRSGNYQLQATPVLSPPDWQTLTQQVTGLGTARFQLGVPTSPAGFFRVLEP